MSELDVIRLTMAIGVLLLMATSAAFGMLWQRQKNLQIAWQATMDASRPTSVPIKARSVAMPPAQYTRNQPLQNAQSRPPVAASTTEERLEQQQPQTLITTAANREQVLSESAGARVAEERFDEVAQAHVNAPLGGARLTPAAMPTEEDRLRALLSGRSGRVESYARGDLSRSDLSRGGYGREPRLY